MLYQIYPSLSNMVWPSATDHAGVRWHKSDKMERLNTKPWCTNTSSTDVVKHTFILHCVQISSCMSLLLLLMLPYFSEELNNLGTVQFYVKFIAYNLKILHIHQVCHCCITNNNSQTMCIIYPHTKFHMPSCNHLSVTTNKPKQCDARPDGLCTCTNHNSVMHGLMDCTCTITTVWCKAWCTVHMHHHNSGMQGLMHCAHAPSLQCDVWPDGLWTYTITTVWFKACSAIYIKSETWSDDTEENN
jgi:hypothetical protein